MEEFKVSIIVPTYNNERYIRKCLDSLIAQSYSNIEIIVINDGSCDGTKSIIEEFVLKDHRIIFIDKENEGVSIARNIGISKATGYYLTFVDGDDYVGDNYIRDFVLKAREKDSDFIITGLKYVDIVGNLLKEIVPDKYIRFKDEQWAFKLSLVACHLYKKSLFDDNDIRFYESKDVREEDIPISLYFSGVCEKIDVLPASEYYYVQHSSSASHNLLGLKTYRLPYASLEEAIFKAFKKGICNSKEYFELFVFMVLGKFAYLSKGASKRDLHELCDFIYHIVNTYFKDYRKNHLLKLFSSLDIPLLQKKTIFKLRLAIRTRILYFFLWIRWFRY